jgi:hypothetical protein
MCGIFSLLNNDAFFKESFIHEQFMKGRNRGPEFSKLHTFNNKCILLLA